MVIPAYQETIAFITRFLESTLANDNVLLIIVVNQPDSDSDSAPQKELFEQAKSLGITHELNDKTVYVNVRNSYSDLLLVNRFEHPIPQKKGVGLARKIGCDIACKLSQQHIVFSEFIASTDADAHLPDNYFHQQTLLTQPNSITSPNHSLNSNVLNNNYSGACYNFSHIESEKQTLINKQLSQQSTTIHNATLQYEQALRYYVDGLRYANSPYAFFTIGSILTFNATAYANVRGFPKKSAGEDFYLLNKLAKVGRIAYFCESTVELTSRLSTRVPFGTGPAVQKIIELSESGLPYCYYAPAVFNELKQVNAKIIHLIELPLLIDEKLMQQWLSTLPLASKQALLFIGFEKFIEQHRSNTPTQRSKQWLVWFDAFKTLKFIHAVRDIAHPNITLSEALKIKPF